ncbi:anthranilate synthase component II [Agrilactobacillus yilanensis]|uniref:Anthranilate synthase component II n=1 Tax=Agrilactobacillus yilanensis TaxID=2485997 RepID=A0ABW4J4X6_9LACO|nr:aminodeoxychorismate/anthranilate synthase component II [Agrilactobacillus yilanensis]
MLYLIDNYDSFTYNLYQLVGTLTDEPVTVVKNDTLSVAQLLAKHPSKLLLSPGPGRPENAGYLMAYLKAFVGKVPILGVCLGHQAIGAYYGVPVVHSPQLMHGKASNIHIVQSTPLFKNCPQTFTGARYHSLVLQNTLPENLKVTATTDTGTIMGIADPDKAVYGVQFHPESILTDPTVGTQLLQNFLKI